MVRSYRLTRLGFFDRNLSRQQAYESPKNLIIQGLLPRPASGRIFSRSGIASLPHLQ
jgi:hypothetical protein